MSNHTSLSKILDSGKSFFLSSKQENHRYLSWEHCHNAFKKYKGQALTVDIADYLSLHLAWYLASWGMLRNSLLMQKDYKVHTNIIKIIFDSKWTDLWDIELEKLADQYYANKIMSLANALCEEYRKNGFEKNPTDTLITKILLGTLACTPAYDRYFKKALSQTKASSQVFSAKSLMRLGNFYINNKASFDELRSLCNYPSAKIIDMCFFEYGLTL